jgi:hypothetical protein
MLVKLLRGIVAAEVAGAQRVASGFMLLLLAAGLLLMALIFALMAAVWALMTVMAPWQAALVVAGAALLLAVVIYLWGRARIRSWRRRSPPAPRATDALRSDPGSLGQLPAGVDGRMLVMAAVVAGIVLGRKLSK